VECKYSTRLMCSGCAFEGQTVMRIEANDRKRL